MGIDPQSEPLAWGDQASQPNGAEHERTPLLAGEPAPRNPLTQSKAAERMNGEGGGQRRGRKEMSDWWKPVVSVVYVLSMICLGACYGAQGPATLHIAEQVGILKKVNGTFPKNVKNLPELGLANALDAGAGVVGGLVGGYLVDRLDTWHVVLTVYLIWQGLTFIAFTMVKDYETFLAVSVAWGWSSTLPSLSTQAAMTWLWADRAGPWLQLNNAGFGIGALTAPLLLSWDIDKHGTFHTSYWIIAIANLAVAFTPLLLPSPNQQARAARADPASARDPEAGDSPSPLTGPPRGPPPRGELLGASIVGVPGQSVQSGPSLDDDRSDGGSPLSPTASELSILSTSDEGEGGYEPERNVAQAATNTAVVSSWSGATMWTAFFAWFVFYVATELGIANWASPYATLEGVMEEGEAAVLTTVYYGSFTLTRLLAAQLTATVPAADASSILVVWICDIGALGAMVILVFSGRLQSNFMLWLAMAMLGTFTGPLWPAQLTVLPEKYGVELSAKHMAVALALSKLGMAAEQLTFSWVLADFVRGQLLPYVLMGIFGGAVVCQMLLLHCALPRLERTTAFGEIYSWPQQLRAHSP